MTPIAVPGPAPTPAGDPFLLACQTYPKLWAKLTANCKTHKVNGQAMNPHQLAAWKLAGDYGVR